jgi:hypothetical protein
MKSSVVLAHPSLFTALELDRFEKEILANPRATERDASAFFTSCPKFLLLGRGKELRREELLLSCSGGATYRVDFLRKSYGQKYWDIIEIKSPQVPFVAGAASHHPRLSSEVLAALSQAEDYRERILSDPEARARLRVRGVPVHRPMIVVVVGRGEDVPFETLVTLQDRALRAGLEAYTYGDLYRFAKDHYASNAVVVVACPLERYPDPDAAGARLRALAQLKTIYNVEVRWERGQLRPCGQCSDGYLRQNDKVTSAGGSGVVYETLVYCDRCGYHNCGPETWTSDY